MLLELQMAHFTLSGYIGYAGMGRFKGKSMGQVPWEDSVLGLSREMEHFRQEL